MRPKHLIKIVTLLWRIMISTKIMEQSEQQALNKFSTRKGDIFWLYHAKLTLVCLCSLELYLCSSSSKCSHTNRTPCKILWIAFIVVWELLLPFRPQALNWEQLRFVVSVKKVRWWILMFLTSVVLFQWAVSEIIVQVKILILSSVRSNKHMRCAKEAITNSFIWTPAAI